MNISEIEFIEKRYELENAFINAVTAGNEEAALQFASQIAASSVPKRLSDELRDTKNYLITANTLLRKAVEMAGIHPVYIDNYSNRVGSGLEALRTLRQCQTFLEEIIRGYCRLVREHRHRFRSPPVERILIYVEADLRTDLSLKTLAEYLGVNPSYLSSLFSRELGMSLTDYVNGRRIQLARELLISTSLPIKSIAQQCGLPDVHYFSRLFKRRTGTTPRAYRESFLSNRPEDISFYIQGKKETRMPESVK